MEEIAKFLKVTPDSKTENGADTFSSSLNANVDLFAMGGAVRSRSENEIEKLIMRAFLEDPKLAIRNLFRLRDAREGVGERNTFRIGLNRLARESSSANVLDMFFGNEDKLKLIAEYGRWDDIFSLVGTKYESNAMKVIRDQFHTDMNLLRENGDKAKVSLLGKWLPSINASKDETRKLAFKVERALELNHKTYRKNLAALREQLNILERNMMTKAYSLIDYSKVPSLAFMKHMKAFKRNDDTKFSKFMDKVNAGEAKVNTSVLFPADIVHKLCNGHPWSGYNTSSSEDVKNLTTIWNNLPNYLGEGGEQALVIADTSGSMSGTPIEVALSLALYYAERNKGPWQNHFMTFSAKPQMQCVRGSNLLEKFQNMASAHWDSSTNVEAAFQLILDIAKQNKLTQDELPKKLYIVSDMEFNSCCRGTNYQNAQKMFADAGYKLPTVVFWNVSSRNDNLPVRFDEEGTALVSGYSATIFKSLVGRDNLSPVGLMLEVLDGPRYKDII